MSIHHQENHTFSNPQQGLAQPISDSRNIQLFSITTQCDLRPSTATLLTPTFRENKHNPAKWLKIPEELVIKILVCDIYKPIMILAVWVVCFFNSFNLILLIVLGIDLLGFLFVILEYESCRINTGKCQARI